MKTPAEKNSPSGTANRARRVEQETKRSTNYLQQRPNIQPSKHDRTSWTIPRDERYGVSINIGDSGHVILKQQSDFADEDTILLHPTEAKELQKILPSAIAAANRHRKELR
jgi:hypothetical protein